MIDGNLFHLENNQHKQTDEPGVIVLSDKVQFDKVLQKQLPPDPEAISSSKENHSSSTLLYSSHIALDIPSSATFDRPIPSRGLRRWKTLPTIKDTVIFCLPFR